MGIPDSKVRVANTGATWVLASPGGPHVGPMNLAIRDIKQHCDDLSALIFSSQASKKSSMESIS